jgi:heme-degrading monooxygenase HmoA
MALIEIMTFRLQPDIDDNTFIAADAVVQAEFAYQQPGIVRRTIARSDDDTWLIHTIWASDEAAHAAAEAFAASDLGSDFLALIDEATLEVRAFTPAGAA